MNGFFNYGILVESIGSISKLDDQQFEALAKEVSTAAGFDHSLRRCNDLSTELGGGFDASDVFGLLASLEFLYDRAREWEKRGSDLTKSIGDFLEVSGLSTKLGPKPEEGYAKLARLVAKNPALDRISKLRRLRSGLLDTAMGFSSFVDIRPRFAEDRTSLEELVPIVILRVQIKSEDDIERSPVFQLDLGGLARLRAALDDVDKKLKALKEDPQISGRLNSEVSRQEEDE